MPFSRHSISNFSKTHNTIDTETLPFILEDQVIKHISFYALLVFTLSFEWEFFWWCAQYMQHRKKKYFFPEGTVTEK